MTPIIQRLKSKTYWVAVLGAALTALDANGALFTPLVSEEIRPYLMAAWPVLMLVLRELTSEPLSAK